MTASVSDILFSRLSKLIAARMGLYFPRERRRDLERGIRSAAGEFGFKDVEPCIRWLLSSSLTKKQIKVLAAHLTIGETYFFREKEVFEVLEGRVFPELICSRRETVQSLRVWSAGCATGEEPYSLAILLNKMVPDLGNWNITVLATDVNLHFLRKASEGIYGEWSFRGSPLRAKERYFQKTEDGRFAILTSIKEMVTFSSLNLAEDYYPLFLTGAGAMDIIFCRNVLMYFAPEQAEKVVEKFHRSLVEGGWLVVGQGETSPALFFRFRAVNFSGLTFYKKDSRAAQTVESFALPSFSAAAPEVAFFKETREPCLDQRVDFPEEVEERKKADKLNDSEAMALSARVCANRGMLAEALHRCEKAIAMDRLNPGFHYLRATILQEQGLPDEAVASLKRVLYLDQGFVPAHFALGLLTRRQGKSGESDRHFENALILLSGCRREEILPESEGITAGRLSEIIASMIGKEGFTGEKNGNTG